MELPGVLGTFYYEYYDVDGVLICIEPQQLQQYGHINNPGEIAHLVCCGIRANLDEDQRVSPIASDPSIAYRLIRLFRQRPLARR